MERDREREGTERDFHRQRLCSSVNIPLVSIKKIEEIEGTRKCSPPTMETVEDNNFKNGRIPTNDASGIKLKLLLSAMTYKRRIQT